jgi:4-amino-4-deoxy-L-arabinose transferase-like glycosyltransferase
MNSTNQPTSELHRKRIFLLLALYFIAHLLIRLFVSDSAELDEAEQLLLTQDLRLGYGSQPPLYTWLLTGLFSLFGIKIFALALIKNSLLFLTYLFVYLSAKEITHDNNRAIVAMLSLLLIPQIFWESQRDLTHSVLGTTVAACTLFVMLRLLKSGRLYHYALFGLCAGAGLLSKYNYGIFLVALFLAACSLEYFRPQLLNRKMLLSLLCLLLVTSPHVYWVLTNMQATLSQAGKFQMGHSLDLFASYSQGFQRLLKAVVAFLGMLFPVYALFFYKQGRQDVTAAEISDNVAYVSLVRRMLLMGLCLCVLMILFFKVTVFKDRWMQPLLFATPLYLVTLSWGRFTLANARRYAGFALFVAVTVLLIISGPTFCASQLGKLSRLNSPYAAFSVQLRQAGFQNGLIVAEDRLVGGNLKLFFPESVIVAPKVPVFAAPPDIDRLIVWDATENAEMPDHLHKFVGTLSADFDQLQVQYIQSPYKYVADRSMRLGFLLLKKKKTDDGM